MPRTIDSFIAITALHDGIKLGTVNLLKQSPFQRSNVVVFVRRAVEYNGRGPGGRRQNERSIIN